MTTYFCSQRLLYTYGTATPGGGTTTYYMYAGKCNNDHALPCFTCSYSSTTLLRSQNCPGDPCVKMLRLHLEKAPDPTFGHLIHDFADDAISLADALEADHDTLAPSPSPKTLFSCTQRFFVTFRKSDDSLIYAQCRQLLITELSPLSVFLTGVGFEIRSLPTGEVALEPDRDALGHPIVAKMDPGDPNSGLYRVAVGGNQYHVICTV